MITLPDPKVPDLCLTLATKPATNDIDAARNIAATIREACGPSELTRLLDRMAEEVEWLRAGAGGNARRIA
jgi:hypothetical protein